MTGAKVLLALGDADAAATFVEVGRESGEFTVVATATTSGEVYELLDDEVDVIVIHEGLGPLPTFDLARDISVRHPDVGMVLLARQPSQGHLDAALRSGFRGIARLPMELEEIVSSVTAAAEWTRAVRLRLQPGVAVEEESWSGRMVAVAGGKGGVGTTSIATHLAVLARQSSRGRRVCLVDLDLQTGDVRGLLDLTHRRSITDLLGVAAELSSRQLDDALSAHASGLRVLLPPVDGELGEDVRSDHARRILGGLRSRFDVVVVDVGSVMTEASLAAVELADVALLVTTPDVPAMRGANRLLGLWERLQVDTAHVRVVINQTSRDSEIQPDMVRRIVEAETLEATVPADFWALETPANTGNVTRLDEGAAGAGIRDVAAELSLAAASRGRRRRPLAEPASGQGGSITVEWLALMPFVLLVAMFAWQATLWGFTYVLASNSAREAARVLTVAEGEIDDLQPRLEQAARERVPSGWRDELQLTATEGDELDTVTVELQVPILVPGRGSPWMTQVEQGVVRESSAPLPATGTAADGEGAA